MKDLKDFVCLTSHCKCNSKCDDCSECENEIDKWLSEHDSGLLDKVAEKLKANINTILDEPNYQHDGETWQNGLIIASDSLDEVIAEMKVEVEK